jgi:tetratricopeptide (TPR) repeat protein
VSLNLVRPDRTVAWADTVEARLGDLFSLQSRLTNALTSALVVRVSPQERALMERPPTSNPEALTAYWQGSALLERTDVKGNVEAAIRSFERALSHDPNCALAHAGLGQAYRRRYLDTRDPAWAQRAIEEASLALRMDGDRPEVRYALAVTYAGSGRLNEAVQELNRALAVRPNYEDARRQLGEVLAQQGQIEAAIAEFRKAIALRPASPTPYSAMGLALYRASRYQEAARAFEDQIKVAPDSYLGYTQLGTVYQMIGRTDDAVANYQKSLAIRPSAGTYSNMGALLHKKGDFEGAVKAYEQALALRPSAAARRNIGDALLRLHREREARAAYRDAAKLAETELKVNPTDARIIAALGVYLQKAGEAEAAWARMTEALKLAPDNPEVLYRSAVVQVLSGKADGALQTLDVAVNRGYSRENIKDDDDWMSLRRDPRFMKVISGETK